MNGFEFQLQMFEEEGRVSTVIDKNGIGIKNLRDLFLDVFEDRKHVIGMVDKLSDVEKISLIAMYVRTLIRDNAVSAAAIRRINREKEIFQQMRLI